MVMEVRKRKKQKKKKGKEKKINNNNNKRKRHTGGWPRYFVGERNRSKLSFIYQVLGRASWWPHGRRTTNRSSKKFIDGSFRGGGYRWKEAGSEKEDLEIARMEEREREGMRRERNLGRKKENEEEDGPLWVDEGWGARKMEGREKEYRGGEDMGGTRSLGKKKGDGLIWVGQVWQLGHPQNREDGSEKKREKENEGLWGLLIRVIRVGSMELRISEVKEEKSMGLGLTKKEENVWLIRESTGTGLERNMGKKEGRKIHSGG